MSLPSSGDQLSQRATGLSDDHVGECEAIELAYEDALGAVECYFEDALPSERAWTTLTVHETAGPLQMGDDGAEPDRFRLLGETHAAGAPLQRLHVTRAYQALNGLLQMVERDPEGACDIGRPNPRAALGRGEIHEQSQREIRVE